MLLSGQTRSELKIIFMSGYADAAVSQHGLIPQGAVFLQKPVALSQLSQTIARLMHEPEQPGTSIRVPTNPQSEAH